MKLKHILISLPEELHDVIEEIAESDNQSLEDFIECLLAQEAQKHREQRIKEARERDERTMQAIHECAKKLGIGED